MKYLNKVIIIVLCCSFFINSSNTVYAISSGETTNAIQTYSIPVRSNEYPNTTVTFYGYHGKYYLSFDDIKDFTRCELSESDLQLTLNHGLREIHIEKDTGYMTDSNCVEQGKIDILKYNGKYLCEGIPMLRYLGATCTLKDDKEIEILMPSITIWEAIMPDYLEYYFDIVELKGGESNVKVSLACDILADLLDGISGHGLYVDADTHLEDALYEILNVDMLKYESVQTLVAERNQNINSFLERMSIFLEGGTSTIDIVKKLIKNYADFYLNNEIWKNENRYQESYLAGEVDDASDLSRKINQQVYEQSVIKSDLNADASTGTILKIGMFAFDVAISSYNLMQYNDDTRNLFSRTINDEIFKYAGYSDISWNNVSSKISKTLSSNDSIILSSTLNSIVDFATGEITEKSVEKALSGFTSKGNIYAAAAQLGSFIASLINYKSNQAFSADMNAIWLSVVQYDIAQLASRMLIKEKEEHHFSNAESLKKLKDMFTLYYRTIIAFSENIAESVEKFGGRNKKEWIQYFDSISDYAAIYLYRITNCTIIPIQSYIELEDNILKAKWVENYKNNNAQFQNELLSLIASKGIFAQKQSGIMQGMGDNWFDPKGILSATILDFDLDGSDEMLVCVAEECVQQHKGAYHIILYMYDIEGGEIILADTITLEVFGQSRDSLQREVTLNSNHWLEEIVAVNAVLVEDKYYIICEDHLVARAFGDGSSQSYWALEYINGSFQYVCSFAQTDGGSTGFEYMGYFFEDGICVKSDLYYSDPNGYYRKDNPLYTNFGQAISNFFGQYDIQLNDTIKNYEDVYDGYDYFQSILSPENHTTLIFELVNTMSDSSELNKNLEFSSMVSRENTLFEE